MAYSVKPLLLLFLCVSSVVGTSKRSVRWDTHVDHQRSKRQFPAGCNWQLRGRCTLQGQMDNDALSRRASGLLATPGYQGSCGSCWAFASTHVYTDTRSIMENRITLPLAPQYPASCFQDGIYVGDGSGNGCCGGNSIAGFVFFKNNGAITESCAPYHNLLTEYNSTDIKQPISQTCPAECADGTTFNPTPLRLHGFKVLNTEAEVIQALADRTVFIAMLVSQSFLDYGCGVFCERLTGYLGAHAMEIVDYGTEAGVDFWVVKNSWGTNRGEGGYIRMRRGDNIIRYVAPILSSSDTLQSDQEMSDEILNLFTCAATTVTRPTDDVLVMSAVEHAINDINEMNSIRCPDGRDSSMVTLSSVVNATTQVVDGIDIELNLLVNIRGCAREDQRAQVRSSVMLLANNAFETTTFSHMYVDGSSNVDGSNSSGTVVTSYAAMILLTVAIIAMLVE